MTTKVKKPFYKKWWVWVLAVIIIGAIANGGGGGTGDTAKEAPKANTVEKQVKQDTADKPASKEVNKETNKPTITLDEFNQIQNGMTYEQVVKIIGGEGTLQSSAGDGQYKTEMYSWEGEGGFGANANVTFQGGKVQAKAQLGLQ